jgi:hypothetical protein
VYGILRISVNRFRAEEPPKSADTRTASGAA